MKKTLQPKKVLFRVMQITGTQLILALLFIGTNYAFDGRAQAILDQKITMQMQEKEVRAILQAIEKQTEARFVFSSRLIPINRKITLNATNETLVSVLNRILKPLQIEYEVSKKLILLRRTEDTGNSEPGDQSQNNALATPLPTADQVVAGTVSDENAQPLPGVSVVIKGTSRGSVTDPQGKYRLAVPDSKAILIFSYVGFQSQEIVVENRTTIDISLKTDNKSLNEVVVVGYGTQQKKDLSTAISSVKGTELNALPTLSPAQALVGKMAGITLQQSDGSPGNAPVIRIRGNGSISNGNSPLYVIDGYPTADGNLFNSIPPSDIESVDILKDAASAAIYGSRAGNGVVVVTTKRGREGRTRFNLDITQGQEQITHKYPLLNADQFVEMATEWYNYQKQPVPAILTDPSLRTATDWQDAIFQKAAFSNYQLGATGGTEKAQYAVSGGYTKQEGIIKRTGLERYNFRLNLDANLTKRLRVGASMQPTFSIRQLQRPTGSSNSTDIDGLLAEATNLVPIVPIYKSNGDYLIIPRDPDLVKIFNTQVYNPVNKIDANNEFNRSFRLAGSTYVELEPLKGLKLRSAFNLGLTSEKYEQYLAPFVSFRSNDAGNLSTPNFSAIRASRQSNTYSNWYLSNTATYQTTLATKHNLTALLGYDVARQSDYGITLTTRTDKDNPVAFDNDLIPNVQGAILNQGSSFRRAYVFDAVFGRVEYNFNQQYYLTASLRRDRSSRFGPNNRAGVFPSVSAAWRIIEEPFVKSLGWLSDLKIRASYGETGNDQLSSYYPWLATLNKTFAVFGTTDARVLAYAPSAFSNRDLRWEKNRQIDIGMNMGVLNNRVNLTADYYERNSNAILSAAIPNLNGIAESYIQNIGNIRNRGLELALDTRNLTGVLQWNTNVNISFNRNQITKLGANQTQLTNLAGGNTAGDWTQVIRNYLGRPMGDIYLYDVIGVFNNQTDVDKSPKLGTQAVGDLKFRDANGDGKITPDDMVLAGNYQPAFTYGMTNSFRYKAFELSFTLQGSYGGEIVNAFERVLTTYRNLDNSTTSALHRWRSEQDPGDGKTPRAGSNNVGTNIGPSTRYLYSSSFLRLRNLVFGYNIPAAVARKVYLQNARLFVTGQNLLTFTKYPGYNPETNFYGDNAIQNGVDFGSYPVSRNLSVGLNLGF
jgi:TonB-linked SusC/RagA family outer membrane protein